MVQQFLFGITLTKKQLGSHTSVLCNGPTCGLESPKAADESEPPHEHQSGGGVPEQQCSKTTCF